MGLALRNIFFASAILLLSISCTNHQIISRNLENLSRLSVGMTKQEVLGIMGEPLTNEVYNEDNVWYYFTQVKWSDGMITHDECTPVFFEDGKLLGWGQAEFKKHRQRVW
ncbi:MAG: DUF3192 domain-containing protein [Victivallales bacterium]|nr:DUF3192 domain-containing protein [Victivallales bacterium]